jgi:hypothetical protein
MAGEEKSILGVSDPRCLVRHETSSPETPAPYLEVPSSDIIAPSVVAAATTRVREPRGAAAKKHPVRKHVVAVIMTAACAALYFWASAEEVPTVPAPQASVSPARIVTSIRVPQAEHRDDKR